MGRNLLIIRMIANILIIKTRHLSIRDLTIISKKRMMKMSLKLTQAKSYNNFNHSRIINLMEINSKIRIQTKVKVKVMMMTMMKICLLIQISSMRPTNKCYLSIYNKSTRRILINSHSLKSYWNNISINSNKTNSLWTSMRLNLSETSRAMK